MILTHDAWRAAVAGHPVEAWFASLGDVPVVPGKHGDWSRWQAAVNALPALESAVDLTADAICVGGVGEDTERVAAALRELMPWRKGPWSLQGVAVDTEWRSDWKWQRLVQSAPHLDFSNKVVLDVGSGNGYFGYRLLGAGARAVLGVDPTWLFMAQFYALQRLLGEQPITQLPLTCEALPAGAVFDVVLSMGVLYHRRSPLEHLLELKSLLQPGGELVLETIVIEGDEQAVLVPAGRYMRMRNVWFVPSALACQRWLQRLGFVDVQVVHECATTVDEQRATEWMAFESLAASLNAEQTATVEGYPVPRRAILTAVKP